ncbi:AAA family ATPase [Candidatus Woesearchaeota archaeon]|nr:AAA family ATPase [Candidatus Woesearchaeota archaeon]
MNKIIAVVGMTGSGKTETAEYIESNGYQFLRFGQIVMDEIKKRGLTPTEKHEKEIRERFRKEHGMAAFAILNQPKIEELLKKGPVVIDGLGSWDEYKVLKEKYKENIIVLSIFASPKIRYERLSKRTLSSHDKHVKKRPATIEQAKSRDKAEIENTHRAGPIAMADYTIINEESEEILKQNIDKFIKEL